MTRARSHLWGGITKVRLEGLGVGLDSGAASESLLTGSLLTAGTLLMLFKPIPAPVLALVLVLLLVLLLGWKLLLLLLLPFLTLLLLWL